MFPSVLVVDDESFIRKALSGLLSDEGFEVTTANNGYEALKLIETDAPDLVLLDIWMPGLDGIETLKEIKKDNPATQVIIITGHGTIETAIKATKLGAFDLLEKPLSIDKVIVAINNALNFRRLEEENKYLRKKIIEKHSITGSSTATNELKMQIAKVAPTDSWVLVTGANGTGKEMAARTIHNLSKRSDHPLIDVNCAAIPDEMLENELFGQEKNISKGFNTKIRGKFELANNGTLFLDEVGDMSLKTQSKIIRALDDQQFQRVGGGRTLKVDMRVIASTNKNLEEEIKAGRFREELYFRINVIPIHVPSLHARIDDLPLLADLFLSECVKMNSKKKKKLSDKALEVLKGYSWPGNVRELKNLIGRLDIMISDDIINEDHIPWPYNPGHPNGVRPQGHIFFNMDNLKEATQAFEKFFIIQKLKHTADDLAKTAKNIGVDRSYIQRLLSSNQD